MATVFIPSLMRKLTDDHETVEVPGSTLRQVIDSITRKLLVLPDDTAVYPGHGADTTIGEARQQYQEFASRQHPADLCGDVNWLES